MIANNMSPDFKSNSSFKREQAKKNEGNLAWLKRVSKGNDYGSNGLLLFGGNSVADFRIRVAQSYLRHDLTPSYWSLVGILSGEETFYSVPLEWRDELSEMPHRNGIQNCSLADYDDPQKFPNVALIQFTAAPENILKFADLLRYQRSNVVDLVALVISWLGYVWGVGKSENPLQNGEGLPSAVFAETVYGICGIELTPGLESTSSCPEAIWQAAKWWRTYYEESNEIITSQAQPIVPKGAFALRQPAAAVHEKPFVPPKMTRNKKKSND
jgi:hypothetical protein